MERVSEWQQQSKDDEKAYWNYIIFMQNTFHSKAFLCGWVCAFWSEWMSGWVCACVCLCISVCFFIGFYVHTQHMYYTTWACECLRFDTSVFLWMLLPVSLFSSPFSRCNNTILFSKHPNRNTHSTRPHHTAPHRIAQKSKRLKSTYILFQNFHLTLCFIAFRLSHFSFITFYSFHFHYSYKTHTIHMARAFCSAKRRKKKKKQKKENKIKWKYVYDMAARSLAKCFEMALKQLNTVKVHVYLQNDQTGTWLWLLLLFRCHYAFHFSQVKSEKWKRKIEKKWNQ